MKKLINKRNKIFNNKWSANYLLIMIYNLMRIYNSRLMNYWSGSNVSYKISLKEVVETREEEVIVIREQEV